ncbi:MAG: protein phosphatase 2C domain-containing protein [candidate division WOR-3 bacterium]
MNWKKQTFWFFVKPWVFGKSSKPPKLELKFKIDLGTVKIDLGPVTDPAIVTDLLGNLQPIVKDLLEKLEKYRTLCVKELKQGKELGGWNISVFVAPGKRKDSSKVAEMAEDAAGALFLDHYVLLWVADGASEPVLEALEKANNSRVGFAPRVAARCLGRIFEKFVSEAISKNASLEGISAEDLKKALANGLKNELEQRINQVKTLLDQYRNELPMRKDEHNNIVVFLQWNVAFICAVVDTTTQKGFLWWAGDGLVVGEGRQNEKPDVWEAAPRTGIFLQAEFPQDGTINWRITIRYIFKEIDLSKLKALMLMSDGVSRKRSDIESLYESNPGRPLTDSIIEIFNEANKDDDKSLVILKII